MLNLYERQERVHSGPLENAYLEAVSMSDFGTTTDIRRAPGQEHMIDSVLLGSANNGNTAKRKTATRRPPQNITEQIDITA